jgi:aryl-alcohol dehydrogenase-like predicted oxidoreductase
MQGAAAPVTALYVVHREDPHTPLEETLGALATRRSQLDDNLKATAVQLAPEELAELDGATALAPVYPNWFIGFATGQPVTRALGARR